MAPAVRDPFLERMKEWSAADSEKEFQRLKIKQSQLRASCERLAKALAKADEDDEFIMSEYSQAQKNLKEIGEKILDLPSKMKRMAPAVIETQTVVDPRELTQKNFEPDVENEIVNTFLCKAFDEIIVFERVAKNIVIIRVTVSAGIVAAVASNTEILDQEAITMTFRMTSILRPKIWDAELVSSSLGGLGNCKEEISNEREIENETA